MKQGWEYKKLGEVCTKGSSNISLNKIEENNGEYALFGASGYVKGIDFYHQDQSYIGVGGYARHWRGRARHPEPRILQACIQQHQVYTDGGARYQTL